MFGQMQPMGTRSVQFVNGRMSAEAYAMAPNSQEILMDMNRPVFYWKTTDASGMSSVQEYEFKLVEPAQQSYVTMDQLNRFKEEILVMVSAISDIPSSARPIILRRPSCRVTSTFPARLPTAAARRRPASLRTSMLWRRASVASTTPSTSASLRWKSSSLSSVSPSWKTRTR